MAGRELSGRELRQQLQWRHNTDVASALPQRGGLKDYAPDGSWLQKQKLKNFYTERRDILLEERVHTQDSLTTGEWLSDVGKVHLTKLSGKIWKNFGHMDAVGAHWLHPEEALFLIDEGSLEVYFGGVPLSLQKAYSLLLNTKFPAHYYQVYAHLCRLGYILQRHSDRFCLTTYERTLGLVASSNNYSIRRQQKRKLSSVDLIEMDSMPPSPSQNFKHTKSLCIDGALKMSNDLPASISCKLPSSDKSDEELNNSVNCRPFRGWFAREWIPTNDKSNIVAADNFHLLDCVNRCQTDFTCMDRNSPHECRGSYMCLKCVRCQLTELSLGGSAAEKWAKHWQLHDTEAEDKILLSAPAKILWNGPVRPLVHPSQATTVGDVLQRLRVTESINYSILNCKTSYDDDRLFKIIFDVFLPDSNFRKSDPGRPAVCLCIAKHDGLIPSPGDDVRLQQCAAGAMLMFGVVDSGDVTFYSFNSVVLPVDTEVALL